MAVGAWYRSALVVILGVPVILFGGLPGLVTPSRRPVR
jgi:hypothetical protein